MIFGPDCRLEGPIKGSPWILENPGRPGSRAGKNVACPSSVAPVALFRGDLRCGQAETASLGVGPHLEGLRAHGAAPGRTKGVLVGAHEDYIRLRRASPGRTKGVWGSA